MEGAEIIKEAYEDFELMDAFRIVGYSLLGFFIFFIPIKINGYTNTVLYHIYYYIENQYLSLVKLYILIMVCIGSVMPILHKSKECNVFKNIYETIRPISILIILMIFTKSETSDSYNKDILFFIEDIILRTSILFPLSCFFLPLITKYGLLEVAEAYFNKYMKKTFKLSGKNILNIMVYMMVDMFSGIFMTNQLYKEGKLRQVEACTMVSCYAFTSLYISLYILDEFSITTKYTIILTNLILSLIINFILCRIWPLKNKKKSYIKKTSYKESNFKQDKFKKAIRQYMCNKEKKHLIFYMIQNFKDAFNIAMTIIPNLIIIIFIGEIIINNTGIIEIISLIINHFLELLKLPNKELLSEFIILSIFNNIRAIDIVMDNIENITMYIIIFISTIQTVSLTTNIIYIDNTKIPISKSELLVIGVEKILLLISIVSIVYYLIMGYL